MNFGPQTLKIANFSSSLIFASAVAAVVFGELHALRAVLWNDCKLPSDFVNGDMSPIWPMFAER